MKPKNCISRRHLIIWQTISNLAKMVIVVIIKMIIIVSANAQTTQNIQQTKQAIDTVFLYQQVEVKPIFEGKDSLEILSFYNYVRENSCECLFETYGHGIPSAHVIEFVIDKDGFLVNAKVMRDVDPLLDAELLRVVNSSPQWTPGKHDGKSVRVKCILVIRAISHGCVVPQGWSEECLKCLQEKSNKMK